MDHKNCRENLSAFMDGELPAAERAAVEAHLSGCPECGGVLAGLRAVSGLVKKHVMEPVPLSLRKGALAGRPASNPWLKPVLALSTVAAGALVVLNLGKAPDRNTALRDEAFGSAAPQTRSVEALEAVQPQDSGSSLPAGSTLGSPILSGSASQAPAAKPQAAPATARADSAPLELAKKSEARSSAIAAVRGSYGQAKFAASRAGGSIGSALSGSAAGGAGAAAEGESRPDAFNKTYARKSAGEFRGPVCVYVFRDVPRDTDGGMSEAERDEFHWHLDDAVLFITKTGIPFPAADPGRLVFIKNNGAPKVLTEKDCSLGFVLFDGVKDPLVVTDLENIASLYNKYFGTSFEP